ncbi:hypothetical protein HM25_001717 [Salmonella enterica subsp. enterica serovar Carno]|uniref:ParB N-terminal domain-containing protein n=2 Tax=Enterobacteriaceae TaxID=543 RepID=UPI0009AC34B1|nr:MULTISPECIES: ParB N-terminal domain-containing protein [Enterobacteriaceae]EAA9733983.1 hypothetical protein [Salmonella enterica]ECK9682878.1 hypothetical protein [Salmonella enterica subsp. enterica serovar Washington]EDV9642025.1 hypothetical protein [Salmonella enterica subsp. enterica serovar Carno]EIF2896257.1 hypothetical protein [Salmonella enterica subsp. enterica serovar Mishmarhaemek]SUX69425.1 ParB/RepB/Spo0J family partition protein [Citrobacter koseri]
MYMDQLECKKIPVDNIFLDPNNPRFWTQSNRVIVKDKNITDEQKQLKAKQEIDVHGIDDLYNSILRNGFLLLDRIVVRPISGTKDKYVVVEGNRRFRSLTKLRNDILNDEVSGEDLDEDVLKNLFDNTKRIEVLVYSGDGKDDISWMLQGIRHISGIRDWEPAQRAKLVAQQIDKEKKKLGVVGQQFGLSAQATGRLYRTYKALSQMRNDEEFSSKARNHYFSLFEEVLRNNAMKEWLSWSDSEKCFKDTNNLNRFYSWITPDEENGNKRRLNDPKQIKSISYLIENHHTSLIDDFESHLLSIEEARVRATENDPKPKDWRKIILTTRDLLGSLPQSALIDDSIEFLKELEKLTKIIEQRKKMAKMATADN